MSKPSKLDGQWIELFRAGDHGAKGVFTGADLDQMVRNYDPTRSEAPIILGHPAPKGSPAYGWVKELKHDGQTMSGMFSQVTPAVEAAMESGRFKKRSIGIRKPVGGTGWELHHVALLGAELPAIKGLADVQFSGDEDSIQIEFSEGSDMAMELKTEDKNSIIEGIFEKLRNFGQVKPVERTFSEEEVLRMVNESTASAITAMNIEARLAAAETAAVNFSEREQKISAGEVSGRAAAAIQQVKAKGSWVPAFDKMGVPQLFAELAGSSEVIEFGEGESKASKPALDILVNFMESLGTIVPAAAVYTGQGVTAATTAAGQINHTSRTPADPNSSQLSKLATAHAAEKGVDFGSALSFVAAEHPELTVPGGAAAGAV